MIHICMCCILHAKNHIVVNTNLVLLSLCCAYSLLLTNAVHACYQNCGTLLLTIYLTTYYDESQTCIESMVEWLNSNWLRLEAIPLARVLMWWDVAGQRYSGHGLALGRVSDALEYDNSFLLGVLRIINFKGAFWKTHILQFT